MLRFLGAIPDLSDVGHHARHLPVRVEVLHGALLVLKVIPDFLGLRLPFRHSLLTGRTRTFSCDAPVRVKGSTSLHTLMRRAQNYLRAIKLPYFPNLGAVLVASRFEFPRGTKCLSLFHVFTLTGFHPCIGLLQIRRTLTSLPLFSTFTLCRSFLTYGQEFMQPSFSYTFVSCLGSWYTAMGPTSEEGYHRSPNNSHGKLRCSRAGLEPA